MHIFREQLRTERRQCFCGTLTYFIEKHKLQDDFFRQLIEEHSNELDEVMNINWDLLVLDELLAPIAYSIGLRFKEERSTPYILYPTCGEQTASSMEARSLSRNPVVKSVMFPSPPADSEHYFKATSFYYRLYSFSHVFYEIFGFYWIVGPHYMPHIEIFGVNDFSWQNLYKGAAVTFSDSIDRLGWPTSEGMDLVNIGAHCKKSEVLDGELKEFVEDSKSNGTIYLALGTYANWAYAPNHVLNAFANALKQFSSYRIIFSFNGDPNRMPKLPFIKIVKWAPQTAILNHPNTRVFVSHGGLKSIKESLCSKTPLILMPMGAEQGHNAHQLLSLGYGRVLNKLTVTEKKVYSEINHVLQNPYYQERYNRLYDILLDRPIPALDMALFQTERILRAHNNEVVFKRKGIDLYWYEYLYVQLASVLLGAILLLK
ncbi:UDP-glucuronosyltransferase [Aphelenchoides bicaudatus]|nr:UDP-glucuronosyltransferase [Aphelenchoides bicaudatus]